MDQDLRFWGCMEGERLVLFMDKTLVYLNLGENGPVA